MRLPLRSFASLVLAVGVVTCSDTPHAPVKSTAGVAHLALSPVFSPSAAAVYAQRSAFVGVSFDHVRIVIMRPPDEVLKDTTIVFDPASPPRSIELSINVKTVGELLDAEMAYTNNGVVVYRGRVKVQSYAPGQPVPQGQTLVLSYVGPGATAARIAVAPKTVSVVAPGGANFTATVFDSSNAPLPNVPITWSVSDPSLATINATTGALVVTGKRGTATVTATTPTNLKDNGSVVVSLPPAEITVFGGAGQTGKAGMALQQPGVVQVLASDRVGVAGVTVNFAAPAGGSVGATTLTTDENGRASTILTLGGALGPQSFAATAAGFSTSIGATATPGDPAAITTVSGSGQSDTVRKTLKSPFVAKVTDKFGNAVSGVNVSWTRTAGNGTLGGGASTTNDDGLASMSYTLGSTVGAEAVTATVAGVTAGAGFSATALRAAPATIVIVSGNNQAARIGQTLALSVKIMDDQGNGLPGAAVNWTATNGTIPGSTTTDAQGVSANTLTLGTTAGQATATASVGTAGNVKSVGFVATVQSGIVAKLAFRVPPSNGAPATPLSPAIQVELQDAGGNRTPAANRVTIALGANPGQATLGGTLTKTSANGIATFDDLTIDHAGTGYTLVVSSGGVPDVTSAPFDIGGQAGDRLVLPSEVPTTAMSGLRIAGGLQLRIRDADGLAVTTPHQVTATFSLGSAQNNVVATNSDGVATFLDLILMGNGAGTLTFSSPGVQSASIPITVRPGSIVFTDGQGVPLTQPPGTLIVTAGQAPVNPPQIQVRDENGNGLGGVSVAYTLARGATTISSGLVTAGEAGYTSLASLGLVPDTLRIAGNYTFTATIPGFTGSPLTLNATSVPAAPSRYEVTAATSTPAAGATDVISARLTDQYGNAIATPTSRTVNWSSGGPGSFSAQNSNTNSAGVATVTYTVPNTPNTTVNVTATDAQTTSINGTVTLSVGGSSAASSLAIQTVPTTIVNDVVWSPQPVVRLIDAAGAPVRLAGVPVTLTVVDAGGGIDRTPARPPRTTNPSRQRQMEGTVVNGSATTDSNGVATFGGVKFTGELRGIIIMFQAMVPGVGVLTAINSDAVMMPGAAAGLIKLSGDGGLTQVGSRVGVSVGLVDVSGNFTVGPATAITFTPGTGSGTANPSSATTDVEGFATTTWTMPSSPATATLTASAMFGGVSDSVTFTQNVLTTVPGGLRTVSPSLVTTPVGTPILTNEYPRLAVMTAQEAPVPNVQVTFAPTGECSTAPVTVTTNRSGEAGLDSANFTFNVADGGSCLVYATVLGASFGSETFRLIAVPAGQKTWTGATDSDWTNRTNWLPIGAPQPTDQVFVPAFPATEAALLGSSPTIAGLSAEAAASGVINLYSNTLTITGNLSGGTGAVYSPSTGRVVLAAPTAIVSGYVGALVEFGANAGTCGSYTANKFIYTLGAIIDCPLELAGNIAYTVNGPLTVQNQGRLVMTQGAPTLVTTSDATFQGASESGFLTAGSIIINGNLTIANGSSFAQGPNQSLLITGSNRTLSLQSGSAPLTLGQLQFSASAGVTMSVPVGVSASALMVTDYSTLTLSAGTTLAVGPSQSFFNGNSVTTVLGSLNITGPSNFQDWSQVLGSGTMTVNRSTCARSGAALANVSGNNFTASSAQCAIVPPP